MKQHITIEQFNEIDARIQGKLIDWADRNEIDAITIMANRSIYLLLSIGQMIEFLDEHRTDKPPRKEYWGVAHIEIHRRDIDLDKDYWYVGEDGSDELSDMGDFRSKELCDALWKAVKEKLNTL